jgi:hypothetical protein
VTSPCNKNEKEPDVFLSLVMGSTPACISLLVTVLWIRIRMGPELLALADSEPGPEFILHPELDLDPEKNGITKFSQKQFL